MPKLVKTTFEFEGQYSDVWVLVDEEDEALDTWDPGPEPAVVGRPTPRADGPVRASGKATYTVDVVLPGMLHAALLHSPVAHGRLTNLDLEAARRSPGIRAVIGPEEEIGKGHHVLAAAPQFVGEPVAAVAADTAEQAAAGIAALAAAFEALPFVVDLEQGLAEQRFLVDPSEEVRGDPAAAYAAADVKVELEIGTPGHLQTPLEPHAAVADWRGEELTVWTSTQAMFRVQNELAARFELPRNRVRVIAEYVGGGFGGKLQGGLEPIVAAELSRRTGRPVRLFHARREEQLIGGHRAETRQTIRIGALADGTIASIDADVVVGMGVGGAAGSMRLPIMTLYKTENARAGLYPVRLNLRARNAFRAPGVVETTTGLEQAMDEAAIALGLDPLDFRRRAHADSDQRAGKPYSGKNLLACYDRAAELSGWAGRDRLREPSADGLLRGMGCASQIWGGGGGPPADITIRLGSDGLATVVTGIQDPGTGTLTAVRMVAAETIGLPLDRVRASGGDTRPNQYGPAAGGSGTTGATLPAVRAAGTKVRRQLLEVAADMFEIAPEELDLREGRIRSRDQGLDREYTEVTEKLGNATLAASGSRGPNNQDVRVQTWGCQIAQVAVDAAIGRVVVEKIWAVHDVGRIVNPLAATSQVEGGILQALGMALTEERVVDPTTGAPTNPTLDDYKLPTIADTPEIVVDFVNVPDLVASKTGAKGLGEPPIIPTAAAIANAFAHATGRRCTTLPLTPARVLEVLR